MTLIGERRLGLLVWSLLGLLLTATVVHSVTAYFGAFLFALFVYYATRPFYRRIVPHVEHPNVAVWLTLFAVVLPIVLVVGYAAVVALGELDQFLAANSLGQYRSYFEPYLTLVREGQFRRLWDVAVTNPDQPLSPALRRALRGLLGPLRTAIGLVFTVLTYLFLITVFLFYFLRDDHKFSTWFYESVDYDSRVVEFADSVDSDLQIVFFSNLAMVVVGAVLAMVSYAALNAVLPGTAVGIPVLLGLLTGIATLVPVVGMKLIYVPYTAYLLGLAFLGDTPFSHPLAFFVVALIVVDTIPDFFIRSYLSSRGSVHMGLVLLGYVLGSLTFGWYGLFLGPIVVVVSIHFARSIFPKLTDYVAFS